MNRAAVLVAVWLLVGCRGEGKISNVSQAWLVTPRFDRDPTRYALKLEFTMPKDVPIDAWNPWITMTDDSGRHFRAKEMSISTTGDGVATVQRVSAKFELEEGSKPVKLHIGDYYDIDFSSGIVRRRASYGGP